MNTTRTPLNQCPNCGKDIDSATGMDKGVPPNPGDLSVCLYCASFLVFNDDLSVRMITLEEVGDLAVEERSQLVMIRDEIRRNIPA